MYNTIEALAVAVAAYERNGNSYLKENKHEFDYEQDTNQSQIAKVIWSNKSMLRNYFNIDVYSVDATEIDRPPLLKVTNEHRAKAEDIRQFTKKLLFKAMAYDPKNNPDGFPPFDISIFQKVNQEEVVVGDFGFIASAPLYYDKETYAIELAKRMANSQHAGELGGRVSLIDFEVTRSIWSNNYQTNIVQGLCDNNLYFFFTNASVKQGEKIEMTGRIKSHVLEKDKYPMTKLSYVKIKGKEDAPKNAARTDNYSNVFG
jgi:hypothetical protein